MPRLPKKPPASNTVVVCGLIVENNPLVFVPYDIELDRLVSQEKEGLKRIQPFCKDHPQEVDLLVRAMGVIDRWDTVGDIIAGRNLNAIALRTIQLRYRCQSLGDRGKFVQQLLSIIWLYYVSFHPHTISNPAFKSELSQWNWHEGRSEVRAEKDFCETTFHALNCLDSYVKNGDIHLHPFAWVPPRTVIQSTGR